MGSRVSSGTGKTQWGVCRPERDSCAQRRPWCSGREACREQGSWLLQAVPAGSFQMRGFEIAGKTGCHFPDICASGLLLD